MKYSLGISNFLEEISSLSHSIVFLYFFALITEEGFLMSPCYSLGRGEEKLIFPHQESANVIFNSASLYEMAVLKIFAEPLLFAIPHDSPEYPEAKRLLKFLEYFLSLSPEDVPRNSLIREFIGGSIFPVG